MILILEEHSSVKSVNRWYILFVCNFSSIAELLTRRVFIFLSAVFLLMVYSCILQPCLGQSMCFFLSNLLNSRSFKCSYCYLFLNLTISDAEFVTRSCCNFELLHSVHWASDILFLGANEKRKFVNKISSDEVIYTLW